MAINPQTYEGVAYSLAEAGAQVTYDMAEALTTLYKGAINDPDNLSRLADAYTKRVTAASEQWEKDWRNWADEGLLEAYVGGVDETDWQIQKLRASGIRVNVLGPNKKPIPQNAVMARYLPGLTLPLDSPGWMKDAFIEIPDHLSSFNVFRRAAYFNMGGTSLQIIRKGKDLYREVAIQAGSQMFRESDIFTRRAFSQSMLDDFAKRGVQAITYSNGRKMSIEAYSEMVGRTMSGHAAVQASLNRYAEHGYDLVRVSAHFRACELCVPWEGKVLSADGKHPDYPSLDEAISEGLFHPNCAHDINPYIPGLSPDLEVRVSKEEQALIDEHGYAKAQEIAYKAQAQQRHIERQIRYYKRKEITALDPDAKSAAHRRMLDWQKAQREHLEANQYLPRKYWRESLYKPKPPTPSKPPEPPPRWFTQEARKKDSAGKIRKTLITTDTQNGVNIYQPVDVDSRLQGYSVDALKADLDRLPEGVKKDIKHIWLEDARNPADDYWKKKLNVNNFKSFATGDSRTGTIRFYGVGRHDASEYFKALAHESGHLVDKAYKTSASKAYRAAVAKDSQIPGRRKYVTDYATISAQAYNRDGQYDRECVEDFADSVARFVIEPEFKDHFPNRAKFLAKRLGVK